MQDPTKLLESAANAKLIHLNESLIFPMLDKRVDMKLAELCENFKSKGEVRLADVAYISVCRDIMTDLNSVARHGDKAASVLGHNKAE